MSTAAQSHVVVWSQPVNLSGTPQNSEHPAIVADGFGYVHVFWGEDFGGQPLAGDASPPTGNSIFYRRWDGVSWTSPVDVLSVSGEAIAAYIAVDVDKDNQLHAVWTGQSNFYYSSAPSWLADSAHAWSTPVVVATLSARSKWESDIVADPSGSLHIVYATGGADVGVYHIYSNDDGLSWGSPTRLSEPFGQFETSFSNVKAFGDGAGHVHVVWQTNQQEGYGQAVYYARSVDDGQSWSAPTRLGYRDPGDFEAAWPYLASVSESELHLIYLDGPVRGRSQRISQDSGATWSDPFLAVAEMEGVNGYVQPIVDAAGEMHLIVNMRTRPGQVIGIYYSRWLGDGWAPVTPVDTAGESGSSAHYVAATVRLGNELHIVWEQLGSAEIWYASGVIPSIAQTPPFSLPTSEPPTPVAVALLSPTTPASLRLPTPLSEAAGEITSITTEPVTGNSSIDPLVISVAASLMLIGGAAVWAHSRSRHT